jgi:hypothetical protein
MENLNPKRKKTWPIIHWLFICHSYSLILKKTQSRKSFDLQLYKSLATQRVAR